MLKPQPLGSTTKLRKRIWKKCIKRRLTLRALRRDLRALLMREKLPSSPHLSSTPPSNSSQCTHTLILPSMKIRTSARQTPSLMKTSTTTSNRRTLIATSLSNSSLKTSNMCLYARSPLRGKPTLRNWTPGTISSHPHAGRRESDPLASRHTGAKACMGLSLETVNTSDYWLFYLIFINLTKSHFFSVPSISLSRA
jgi:hypothetical protein